MLRRIGPAVARIVGLASLVYCVVLFVGNAADVTASEPDYAGWVLAWILAAGTVGSVGSLFFLLSYDGPRSLRGDRVRLYSWGGMLFGVVLPTSVSFFLLPLVVLVSPVFPFMSKDQPATSE